MIKIKRIDYIEILTEIFSPSFKLLIDEQNNEYVLFKSCYPFDKINGISDKTAFEASENHIHIIDHVKKNEFKKLLNIAEKIGQSLLWNLTNQFPSKKFVVYVSVTLNDSMIIRFHQQWQNESFYYNTDDFNSDKAKVFVFCS